MCWHNRNYKGPHLSSPAPNFSSCIMKTKLSVSEITPLILQSFDDSSSSQRKGNTQDLMWRTGRTHNKNVNWQSLSDPGKNPNNANVLLQQDMFINHTQSHPEKHNLLKQRSFFLLFLTFSFWRWHRGRDTTPVCLELPEFGHKCQSDHKANVIIHFMGCFQLVLNSEFRALWNYKSLERWLKISIWY